MWESGDQACGDLAEELEDLSTDELPTDELPTDELPTDELSTDELSTDELSTDELSTDEVESWLANLERLRSRVTSLQAALVAEADRRQVPTADGCRTLSEWVAGRLDVPGDEASRLVTLARSLPNLPEVASRLATGDIGPARAETIAGVASEADEKEWLERLRGLDLTGAARVTGRHRRLTRPRERACHDESYLVLQPSLDESWWRISGGVTGLAGAVIDKALTDRIDQLPPDATGSRAHRRALALESLCLDASSGETSGSGPTITAFCDLDARTGTETGAELAAGPRIGPDSVAELLCEGFVRIVGLSGMIPVVTSPTSRTIPPAVRDTVLRRDGICRAPGCGSRHRLQPHHIVGYARRGHHHPDNLITLCWYHHHVVVHRRGMTVRRHTDGSIRFVLPADSRDPP